jgi:hypothetical protein
LIVSASYEKMQRSLAARSRAHEGNRVLLNAVDFFKTDVALQDKYASCLQSGKRLRVCLEGDTGHAKAEMLWRLSSQGYGVFQLPFVPWLRSRLAGQELTLADLPSLSNEWQNEWLGGVCSVHDEGRPGLLFVSRSPWTSSLELARRGLSHSGDVALPPDSAVVWVNADEIQVQRRVEEKTFNDPESVESVLRRKLLSWVVASPPTGAEEQPRINSTSAKQGTAALLALVGVQKPVFPTRKD